MGLPLKVSIQDLELPIALLSILVTLVRGSGLLLGMDVGLRRSCEGPLGIRAGVLMLQVLAVSGPAANSGAPGGRTTDGLIIEVKGSLNGKC